MFAEPHIIAKRGIEQVYAVLGLYRPAFLRHQRPERREPRQINPSHAQESAANDKSAAEPPGTSPGTATGSSEPKPEPARTRIARRNTWESDYGSDVNQDAELKQVNQQKIEAPTGQWGGHAGMLLATDMIEVLRAMKQRYCTVLQLAPTLFDATIETLPAEWEAYHTAFHFFLAYGQK